MTETVSGLHSCKPGNEPKVGQIKTFAVIQMPAKGEKNAWTKIKAEPPEKGGAPYRILSADPTGYVDNYGNHSFNIEVEQVNGGDATCAESATNKSAQSSAVPTVQPAGAAMPKDDYWRRREERDAQAQRFIIREHSQSMAIELLKLKQALNDLTTKDLTPSNLRALADYFDNDCLNAAQNNQ